MEKIVLISCASKKNSCTRRAEYLYISPLFKFNLEYAKSLKPDKIFILSAKYGLVDLERKIAPYEKTLNRMSAQEIKVWAKKVKSQMEGKISFENDEIIFLAGEKYRKYLSPLFKNIQIPLAGLGIGRQLKWLKNKTENAK